MLISIASKVLRSINYLCKSDADSTSSLDIIVFFHNRVNDLDLNGTLEYLRDTGHITCKQEDGYWDEIKPTYKGRHHNRFQTAQIKEFLFKSVFVPIAVSVFTTLIVTLIQVSLRK